MVGEGNIVREAAEERCAAKKALEEKGSHLRTWWM